MNECYHTKYILNNRIESCKDFNEEYLFRGISPYEVLKLIKGVPLFFEDHYVRLKNSVLSKDLEFCLDDKLFKEHISTLAKINKVPSGNIKLLLNFYQSEENCLVYFTRPKYPTNEQFNNGVRLSLYNVTRENPNAKIVNNSLNTLALQEKSRRGVYDILLMNNEGNITEGSMSNVFFIQGSDIYTPPLKSVLPGITRKHIILSCEKLGYSVIEKEIHQNVLKEFDSVFITGTSTNVLPVNAIENISLDPKNTTLRLVMREFENTINDYVLNFSS